MPELIQEHTKCHQDLLSSDGNLRVEGSIRYLGQINVYEDHSREFIPITNSQIVNHLIMYICTRTIRKASDGNFYSKGRQIEDSVYTKLSEESRLYFEPVAEKKVYKGEAKVAPVTKDAVAPQKETPPVIDPSENAPQANKETE